MYGYVSLPGAAKMAGCSVTTLRRWVQKQQITAKKDKEGEWQVSEESLRTFLAVKEPSTKATRSLQNTYYSNTNHLGGHLGANVDPSGEALKEAREALARERHVNDELRLQIRDLERERTQHLAEMRVLLSKDIKTTDGVISRWLRR